MTNDSLIRVTRYGNYCRSKSPQHKQQSTYFTYFPKEWRQGCGTWPTRTCDTTGQLLPGEEPAAQVAEYILDASRKDHVWLRKPLTAMPRRNEFLRCEILYEDKDSRASYRGETCINQVCLCLCLCECASLCLCVRVSVFLCVSLCACVHGYVIMCRRIYVCIYVYTYVGRFIRSCRVRSMHQLGGSMCVRVHVWIVLYIYMYTYIHIFFMYVRIHKTYCMFVCMYVCMSLYMCVCIYVYRCSYMCM